jgi:uncharacterized protein (TIGR02246 family)
MARNLIPLSSLAALCISFCCATGLHAQGAAPVDAVKSATSASPAEQEAAKAIHPTSQAFLDAFKRRDSKAIANLWTAEGDYLDEQGQRLHGRAAIEKEYASLFAVHPDAEIRIASERVYLVAPGVAVEDGTIVLTPSPHVPPLVSRFTSVYLKQGDAWKLSNVRETRFNTPAQPQHVEQLGWLVGTWEAKQDSKSMLIRCRWLAEHSFLERRFELTDGEQKIASGLQIVGWDPSAERITSWTFSSDGGHSLGAWTHLDDGWQEETIGVLADGIRTRALNLLRRKDKNTLVWSSVDRMVGDARLPDMDEITLTRVSGP